MDRLVTGLAARLLWAEDVTAAQTALREGMGRSGIKLFAYGNFAPGFDKPYLDTTYPEAWVKRYLDRRYQYIDPVVQEARRSHLPFAWRFVTGRVGKLSPEQIQLFAEAAEHGLVDGFTMPFHGHDGCHATMSFAFASHETMLRTMESHPWIKLLASHYHTSIERLLACPPPCGDLSTLESQCLTWTATGRSLWEISGMAHCTEADVAQSLHSARNKLGAATVSQAVAKAMESGLIALR